MKSRTSVISLDRVHRHRHGGADHGPHGVREILEHSTGRPFVEGNLITRLRNGDEIFPAMLEAIDGATRSIDFLTYVYWRGTIAERFARALADKAREGLRIRVVLDAYGSRKMSNQLESLMREAGVDVRWFRPLGTFRLWRNDKRTHRKLLIIDGSTGFTGGVGIAEEWQGDARNPTEWRDTHYEISGPAVAGLAGAFLDNWNECGDWESADVSIRPRRHADGIPLQVVRSSSTIGWTDIAALIRTTIDSAQSRLLLTTPYFVPDDTLIQLLHRAAERDVDIRLIIPGPYADTYLSAYAGWPSLGELLEAGIKIRLYQPTFLHMKLLLADDELACIGSANLNHRSLAKDEECCVVALSRKLVATLSDDFEQDWRQSRSLTVDEWQDRGWLHRLSEKLAGIWMEQL